MDDNYSEIPSDVEPASELDNVEEIVPAAETPSEKRKSAEQRIEELGKWLERWDRQNRMFQEFRDIFYS